MHIKYLLILIILIALSCSKEKEAMKKNLWISTHNAWMSEYGSFINLIDNDSLYVSQDFDLSKIESYSYDTDTLNSIIIDNKERFGIVEKWTKNILTVKNSLQSQSFIPVRDYKLKCNSSYLENLIASNDWNIQFGNNVTRYEFKKDLGFEGLRPNCKKCLRITETPNWESVKQEYWTLAQIKSSFFLIISSLHMDYQTYQIKEASDSLIIAETSWGDSVNEVSFVIQKKLSDTEFSRTRNAIIGTWKLKDYQEQIDSSILLGLDIEFSPLKGGKRNRPYNPEDSVPILFDTYFQNKELQYTFLEDGKCELKYIDNILREGDWQLSNDGNYIKIQNGWMPSMKIYAFSDSTITTGSHETIEYKCSNGWKDRYIIQKLKKIK